MNTTLQYTFQNITSIKSEHPSKESFMRDYVGTRSNFALEAQVRSGDYFVTLAMLLDNLAKESEDYQARAALEDVISDLIHLQDTYKIIPKYESCEEDIN